MVAIRRVILVFVVLLVRLAAAGQDSLVIPIYLGEDTLRFMSQTYGNTSDGVLFLNLHDNEQTSRVAGKNYLEKCGGKLLYLQNDSTRLVTFTKAKKAYVFDPNRMFTAAGVRSSIKLLSRKLDIGAANLAEVFGTEVAHRFIDSNALIIALHNNTDSNLSIATYAMQQAIKPNSGLTFINPSMDSDDFMLTTDTLLFHRIRDKNINVVWENVDSIEDDGSLSVYAAKKGIAYINIEAQHGHLLQQMDMIDALEDIIKEYADDKKKVGLRWLPKSGQMLNGASQR